MTTRRPDPHVQDMHNAADKLMDWIDAHDAAQAKRRAEREAEERRAKTIPLGGFRVVPSSSEPGVTYVVANPDGRLRCECRGYRGWKPTRLRPERDCRHTREHIAGTEATSDAPSGAKE